MQWITSTSYNMLVKYSYEEKKNKERNNKKSKTKDVRLSDTSDHSS
jgi:hypothetical protein